MNLLHLKNITFSLTKGFVHRYKRSMAGVAQLVRAPGCGPGGRGFETRHSPHSFLFVIFSLGFLFAEQQGSIEIQTGIVSSILTDRISFYAKHKNPQVTIIIDQFCMRSDISKTLLEKLSSNVILCVPSHCVLREDFIEQAQKLNFNLCLSIDYLNEHQWQKIQEIIEKHSWIKGLVIWSVSSDLKLNEFLTKVRDWLSTRSIWIVYANTNNILHNPDIPVGIFMPDGFIRTTDDSSHVAEQANFVVNQAKLKNRGLLLVEPGIHHIDSLINWLQENFEKIQLSNWAK